MTRRPKQTKPEKIETEPDAWERFEKTIGKIVPPKPYKRGGKRNKVDGRRLKSKKSPS